MNHAEENLRKKVPWYNRNMSPKEQRAEADDLGFSAMLPDSTRAGL